MKNYRLKYTSKLLLSCAIFFGVAACSDFLKEEDPSNLTPSSFYKTGKDADVAIAAAYADARFFGDGAGIFSSNWQLLEAPTGTTTTETAQNSDLNNLYSLSFDPNTGHIQNWWRGVYKVIANANLVIENVPGITMDEARKNRVVGEAKFLRAWAYFYAVRLWGDVPLSLEPHYYVTERSFPPRSPQGEVYDQIVADLIAAESAGLSWTDGSGRVSQSAAKSLLAKVYLTMAGFPLNKGAAYYALAATKAKEVIDNAGTIDLFDTYGEIHDPANNNKVEHIFSLQYNSDVAENPMGNMYPNFKAVTYRGNSGTGSTIPTVSFYESYEPGDLRAVDRQGWFYTNYYTNGNGALFSLGAPYIFKHFNVTANGTSGIPGSGKDNLNVPMIRYAEVLLIFAEAQNESGTPSQDAYNALKRIRDRAQLTTPDLATFTQATFREAVWKERWHELAFEGITWFDMVRLRKVYNHTDNDFDDFVGHVLSNSNQPLQEKHLLFPLTRSEMINNPNLRPQNPGYTGAE
ncbi:MAG TPA: RagB/SusD family nutrient uptake outer membrane protein [Chryseosolibacter sp.]